MSRNGRCSGFCLADAVCRLGRFRKDIYLRQRIHFSLVYFTPAGFEDR
jgi:hypothetical protein